jgi:hypothetical protein
MASYSSSNIPKDKSRNQLRVLFFIGIGLVMTFGCLKKRGK